MTAEFDRTDPTPLVVVFLRGGMDGLSMLRPLEDPRLDELRGPLAVPASAALDVGDGFGLHPAMARTAARCAAGSVALLPAIGLPDATRSHFEAQFAVERAAAEPSVVGGWLGRHLAATAGTEPDPFRGISIGQAQLPVTLSGTADALAARSMSDLSLQAPGRSNPEALTDALRAIWSDDGGPLATSAGAAFDVLRRATPDGASPVGPNGGGLLGRGGRRRAGHDRPRVPGEPASTGSPATTGSTGEGEAGPVAEVASLFGSDLGTEVAMINLGGWDDHDELGAVDGAFGERAASLDSTLDQLLTEIAGVTVLVLSEFGRRAATNDSGGCDHGRGGLAMLLGDRVRGGLHGDWPGLDDLDEGDVRTANDIRSVFAAVVEGVLGGDPERALPGSPAPMGRLFV